MSIQSRTKFIQQTYESDTQTQNICNVFILVNSRSGSCIGRDLIRKFPNKTTISHDKKQTHFYVYDLYSKQRRDSCFNMVNKLSENGQCVRIIISGGDGTVEWVISLAIKHKIDFQRVVFGVLPIGTGNDFANSIGWGSMKFAVSEKKLVQLAQRLHRSEVGYYDVWSCKVECYKSGKITEIKNGQQKKLKSQILSKNFTNYVGIGTDACISYLAQKINAKSIFMKKVCYCLAWIQSVCKSSEKIAKKLRSFSHLGEGSQRMSSKRTHELQLSNDIISMQEELMKKEEQINVNENDACLTFLNSTYSMQLNHIWKTPFPKEDHKNYKDQKIDDSIIEVVGYRNQLSLLLQRKFHMAKKVAQGSGRFLLQFKQAEGGKKEETYIHINGQAYKIQNIKQLRIQRTTQIALGKIKVLIGNK